MTGSAAQDLAREEGYLPRDRLQVGQPMPAVRGGRPPRALLGTDYLTLQSRNLPSRGAWTLLWPT